MYFVGALALTACFRQVVTTGLPAGTKTINKPWTSTWIFGLVEATPINVRAECPSGVAVVETQVSFLNGLLGGLTLGIWTPLTVTVTCSGSSASLPNGARVLVMNAMTDEAVRAVTADAIRLSASEHAPIYVVWSPSIFPTLTQ
jgi:hypothetical protein